jgi:carbon storage regulator
MLVLSRRLGEKIAIDGDILVEVLEVSGNRVRLGIVAPDDCRIMRAERLTPAPSVQATRQSTRTDDAGPLRQLTRTIRSPGLPVSPGL